MKKVLLILILLMWSGLVMAEETVTIKNTSDNYKVVIKSICIEYYIVIIAISSINVEMMQMRDVSGNYMPCKE